MNILMGRWASCPKLSLSNFGPLQQADIDLRPLTVFIGQSNTGKSYLSILIYALHNYFSSHKLSFSQRPNTGLDSLLGSLSPEEIHVLKSALNDLDEDVHAIMFSEYSRQSQAYVSQPLVDFIHKIFLNSSGIGLNNEIIRCFHLQEQELSRKGGSGYLLSLFKQNQTGVMPPLSTD